MSSKGSADSRRAAHARAKARRRARASGEPVPEWAALREESQEPQQQPHSLNATRPVVAADPGKRSLSQVLALALQRQQAGDASVANPQ